MATVNIDGDASGAIAACAAAQGAIDALHGKSVTVNVDVRQSGGGGMAGATRDMRDFGNAADRAGRSARGMGDDLGRAGDHMSRMAGDASRYRDHMSAVDSIMRGGAPSSIGRSGEGMRSLATHADAARHSISGIGSESNRSMGAIESGAGRAGGGMRELGAGASGASRGMHELTQGTDGVFRSVARLSGAGKDVEKFAGSIRSIAAVGRSIPAAAVAWGACSASWATFPVSPCHRPRHSRWSGWPPDIQRSAWVLLPVQLLVSGWPV
jgi:hypothetical protein